MPTKTLQSEMQKIPKLRFAGFEGGWEERKLEKVLQVVDGDRGVNYPNTTDFTESGHCLFLNAKNVTKRGFVFEEKSFITKEKDEQLRKGKLKRNDIVLTTRGSIGHISYYNKEVPFDNIRINSGMVLLRGDQDVTDSNFVYRFLDSKKIQNKIRRISFGSAQPQLTVKEIHNLKISFPSLLEQQKIAGFLGGVDEWIENLRTQKESFESYKKGMMQKIFSQEVRFKDDKGNEFSEWEEKRLGDVADFFKGNGISKDDILDDGQNKCIRYGELYTEYSEIISEVKSKTNFLKADGFLSRKNDILIPSSGETALDIASVSCVMEDDILLGGDLNVIRLQDNENGEFFAYYLTHFQNKNIAKLAQGNSVVHLYSSHLKTLKICLPSFHEQQKISEFLTSVDKVLESKQQQITQAEQWKKGLMQGLFV